MLTDRKTFPGQDKHCSERYRLTFREDINNLKKVVPRGSARGGLKVRGQRTKSTGRAVYVGVCRKK
jgi:ribosomal protein S13